jgi:glutathione S-transferase
MKLFVDSLYDSPYAMSAFVALQEKSLPFDMHPIDLGGGKHHEADYAKASITHRVPTLVDGDFTLSESSAIEEYLEEAYPTTRIYPTEVRQRARARQVQAWLRSDLMPIRDERPTHSIFFRPTDKPLSASAQAALRVLLEATEELLPPGGEHLFGHWSIADTDLALMLYRLIANGDKLPVRIEQYARAQWARPSVQQWVRQQRPVL